MQLQGTHVPTSSSQAGLRALQQGYPCSSIPPQQVPCPREESAHGQRSGSRRAALPPAATPADSASPAPLVLLPHPRPCSSLFLPRPRPGPLLPPRPALLPPTATGLSPGSRGSRPAAAAPLTSSPPPCPPVHGAEPAPAAPCPPAAPPRGLPGRRAHPPSPLPPPGNPADYGQIALALRRFTAASAAGGAARPAGEDAPRGAVGGSPLRCAGSRSGPAGVMSPAVSPGPWCGGGERGLRPRRAPLGVPGRPEGSAQCFSSHRSAPS